MSKACSSVWVSYSSTQYWVERQEVRTFVDFYIDNAGALANEVGYIELPEEMYQEARDQVASF